MDKYSGFYRITRTRETHTPHFHPSHDSPLQNFQSNFKTVSWRPKQLSRCWKGLGFQGLRVSCSGFRVPAGLVKSGFSVAFAAVGVTCFFTTPEFNKHKDQQATLLSTDDGQSMLLW